MPPGHHEGTLRILVDGLCPLCRREGAMLLRLDQGRGRIALIDIADPTFDPGRHGLTPTEVVGAIHAIAPDGRVLRGMEVFRSAYARVGWGWLWAPTGWPILRPICDALYRVFARYRPRLSGQRPCPSDRCAVKH
jgi:predicted DCC family thiol-disulfide oxidoreductase YuxK